MAHSLPTILGILGNITALLGLVSPVPTFWRVVKERSSGSFSSQPYLFALLAGLFWTYYGLLKKDTIFVVTISAASCVFQIAYLALYVRFATLFQRIKTIGILVVIVLFSAGIVLAISLLHCPPTRVVTIVGTFCIVTSVFSTAAPLTIIHKVFKTRSVEFMPFYLSLGLFLNNACWLAYALSLKDFYIAIPNAIGLTLAFTQLALYASFRHLSCRLTVVVIPDDKATNVVKDADTANHHSLGLAVLSPAAAVECSALTVDAVSANNSGNNRHHLTICSSYKIPDHHTYPRPQDSSSPKKHAAGLALDAARAILTNCNGINSSVNYNYKFENNADGTSNPAPPSESSVAIMVNNKE